MPAPWLIELRVPPLAAASFPPSSFFLLDSLDRCVRFDVDLSSLEPIFVERGCIGKVFDSINFRRGKWRVSKPAGFIVL